MSFDAHRANVHLEADQITLGNRQDKNTSHIDLFTTGSLNENDLHLKTANLMLDNTASIGFNNIKMISGEGGNLLFPTKPLSDQIMSLNYSSQTLDYELDQIHNTLATKISSSGFGNNKILQTSSAGVVQTGDDIANFATASNTMTMANKTLTSPNIGDIKVVSSSLYIRNEDTGSIMSSNLLAPTKALRIPMYSNNAQNNKDTFMTLINNNSYQIFTSTNVSAINSNEQTAYGNGEIVRLTHGGNWLNDSVRIGGTATSSPNNELEVIGSAAFALIESTGTNSPSSLYLKGNGTGLSMLQYTSQLYISKLGESASLTLKTDDNDTIMRLGQDSDRYRVLYFGSSFSKFITGADD